MFRKILLLAACAVLLGAGFVGGALTHKYRAAIRSRFSSLQSSPIVQTNLYSLRIQKLSLPDAGRDGGIDALNDGLLVVNRDGKSSYISKDRTLQPLALRVPINLEQFTSDPFNAATTSQDRFSVKDILVQKLDTVVRIAAAHMYWHPDRRCNTLRVSVTETGVQALLAGSTGTGTWKTAFESTPCRELIPGPDGQSHHVTLGAGGRLAASPDGQLLLSVGEFSAEYTAGDSTAADADSYGKTILIDVASGKSHTFTRGHRNQQGLAVAPNGQIWGTEHGSRGGDELNLLQAGKHYGAPFVTYGTQYEMMVWPKNPHQGRHEGYEKPAFAWVPSIAPSQLVVLRGNSFPFWAGDLMVSALASQSLYRVRVEDGRVEFVEPIFIGHRIRDIAEMESGTIALKTDDDFLVFVDNVAAASAASLTPIERGELIAGQQCRSCHTFDAGAQAAIGPNLRGVVGRGVASAGGYDYSESLRKLGGRWTPERLRAFVADPGAFAPGTKMQTTTKYTPEQLNDLISYLESIR